MMKILVGLIGSGKSTYAAKLAAERGDLIICDDEVVKLVHGGNYQLYDPMLKGLYKTVEHTIAGMAAALNRDIIVDSARNVNPQTRARWIAIARSFDLYCQAVLFKKCNLEEHARRRFENDHRDHSYNYWLDVVKSHDRKYVAPHKEEGFDEVLYL